MLENDALASVTNSDWLNTAEALLNGLDKIEPFGSVRYRTWDQLIKWGYPEIAFDLKEEYQVQEFARQKGFAFDRNHLERLQTEARKAGYLELDGTVANRKYESRHYARWRIERENRVGQSLKHSGIAITANEGAHPEIELIPPAFPRPPLPRV